MRYDHDYPMSAGHRGIDTSAAAAAAIASSLSFLQAKVFRAIAEAGTRGLTTNELSEHLRIDRGSIQPRTSELRAKGRIRDSRLRRQNANGKRAIVWIVGEAEHG